MGDHMLPNEVSSAPIYLYDWSSTSRVPYSDFLRAKQFERSVRYGIDNQTKQLIATNQQLAERGIKVLSDNLDQGFTMLSEDIGRVTDAVQEGTARIADAVREGTTEIVSALNWGFTEVLISLGQMNINLDELVKLTRTPSQTWACEQFEIARDEFRRQLYPEALQSVTRAIEGLGSNSGIKTEFRFHFLVGIIRLGSYKNSSSEVVDPQLAEQAFLAAARYAQADYPADAGQSLICAGRAALVHGSIDNAIEHTRKGLTLVPTHSEGTYQLGRALFLKGMLIEATDRLANAIFLNVEHALHASGDADFILNRDFLNGVLNQVLEQYKVRYRQSISRFLHAQEVLESFSFGGVAASTLQLDGLIRIQEVKKTASAQAATNTLLGYNSAIGQLLDGFRLFPNCFEEYKAQLVHHYKNALDRDTQERERELSQSHSLLGNPEQHSKGIAATVVASIFGILSAIVLYSFTNFLVAIVIGWCIAAAVEHLYRKHMRSTYKLAMTSHMSFLDTYKSWKISREKEIETIRSMFLPKECELPPTEATKNKISNKVEVGGVYKGTVLKLLDFGAIVNVLPGKEGLLHISQITHERIASVADYLKEGQTVKVKVLEADNEGRIRLSMKAIL